MVVDRLGGTKITGRRNDGVAFSTSASIGADGKFPFYAVAGHTRSWIIAWPTFRHL
jgi:hypothetical protein